MKTALITGCSSGFGLLSAVTLAKHGFKVFATMRDPAKRGRLDQALAAAGVTATVLALDVTKPDSIEAAVAEAAKEGGIDVLVNNAGFGIGGFVEDMSLDDYRRQMDTNFFGLVAVTKAVLPLMRRRGKGRIINLSSIGGRAANGVLSAYCASKFAVEGFSEALAFEAALSGVEVVLIEPGAFKTEIFEANRQMATGAADPDSPYRQATIAIEKRIDAMMEKMAGDAQRVADVILQAATTEKPRFRILVGRDARITAFLHSLGFGVYRRLVGRFLDYGGLAALVKKEA